MNSTSQPSHQMTEWLDLMLDEVRRKNDDLAEAAAEATRREAEKKPEPPADTGSV